MARWEGRENMGKRGWKKGRGWEDLCGGIQKIEWGQGGGRTLNEPAFYVFSFLFWELFVNSCLLLASVSTGSREWILVLVQQDFCFWLPVSYHMLSPFIDTVFCLPFFHRWIIVLIYLLQNCVKPFSHITKVGRQGMLIFLWLIQLFFWLFHGQTFFLTDGGLNHAVNCLILHSSLLRTMQKSMPCNP